MTVRSTAFFTLAGSLCAGVAAAVLFTALAAQPAQALTFENYQGASNGNGWVDLNYDDPDKKPQRQGDRRTLDNGNTSLRFGPSGGSFNQRYDANSYFTPNYILGK